jgi:HlyD family secretion protein
MLLFDDPLQKNTQGFQILAPIDGAVLVIDDKSTRMVMPGDSLMQIGNPQQLEMRIDVLSQSAVKIKAGQPVIIDHWGGEQPLTGRVRRVEPHAYTKVSALGVDEQRVDIIADFDTPPAALADGYRIEARIVIWENPDAIQVPAGALFRHGEKWAAFKADKGHAHLTLLELGRNNGEVAEVLAGLAPGDQVILHPGDRIIEDTLIQPRQ